MSMIDVALIVQLGQGNIILVTYFPFTSGKCRNFEPVVINRYLPQKHRWSNDDYFPSKLDNMYGCSLNCCTWIDMPYFDLKFDKQNTNVIEYIGIEAELLKYMAEKLNFSIHIQWIDGGAKNNANEEATIFGKVMCLLFNIFVY